MGCLTHHYDAARAGWFKRDVINALLDGLPQA
jgi:hypothetical protein